MIRPTRFLAGLVVTAALVAAGCGGEAEPERYELEPTRECLEQAGIEVTTDDLDFVASTAAGGALRAHLPENEVTISLGETDAEAERTATAYRNFAGPTIAIEHVLSRQANAVLVWGAPPSDDDRARVTSCLAG